MQSPDTRVSACIVLPIYNEEAILEHSIRLLHAYCSSSLHEIEWVIIIADNGSRDESSRIGKGLAFDFSRVHYIRRAPLSKGGSIMEAWSLFDADTYVFMDCDLATDLKHLPQIISAVSVGAYDIAVGSRLAKGASTSRSILRELCSRLYGALPRFLFPSFPLLDCQCGFKAISHRVKKELLPLVIDDHLFFDTELLIRGCIGGYRILEMPVDWRDQRYMKRKSKVRLIATAAGNIKKLIELKKKLNDKTVS